MLQFQPNARKRRIATNSVDKTGDHIRRPINQYSESVRDGIKVPL
jgi:hypothetical protein